MNDKAPNDRSECSREMLIGLLDLTERRYEYLRRRLKRIANDKRCGGWAKWAETILEEAEEIGS